MGRKIRGLGPHLTQSRLGWGLAPYPVASWSMQPSGRNRYRPKIGWGLCPFGGGGAGSQSNTMWPGPRPTCKPSFILIRPTVWPQCTNVTDRQTDTQRTNSIGRTVLQMVAQKLISTVWFYEGQRNTDMTDTKERLSRQILHKFRTKSKELHFISDFWIWKKHLTGHQEKWSDGLNTRYNLGVDEWPVSAVMSMYDVHGRCSNSPR